MIYLARIENTIYILHCFTKSSAKTDKRDLKQAEARWKQVQQRLREVKKDEKQRLQGK